MTDRELKDRILGIAKEDGYDGVLSPRSLDECAEVYAKFVDGDGTEKPRFWRAKNGRKSNLNRIQWLLVRTRSFRNWFGRSVVLDENGDPKVMYHGSAEQFDEFKTDAISVEKSKMTLWAGPGFYFSDKKKTAIIYGKKGGVVMEVFLRLENPLVVDETGNAEKYADHVTQKEAVAVMLEGDNTQWLDSTICGELVRMTGKSRQQFKAMTRRGRVTAYVNELKTDVVKLKCVSSAFGAKSQKKMMNAICKHTGRDGVIHKIAPGFTEWVVYDPKAIKSATDNDGDFSRAKACVEDAAYLGEENTDLKGRKSMFSGLIDALNKLKEAPAADHEVAQDIVDRHGRHHQPKAIPEGGQYEEEGQYLHGQAKVDAALRKMAHGKHAAILRDHVAPMYAAMGKDSITRAKIQAMHEDIRGLSKNALLRGMSRHLKDAKKHAEAYEEVKDMDKEQFKNWLNAHPEYAHDINTKLLNESRYNGQREIKGGFHDDGTGHQKHEAWEEAKWSVGAKAMASMILFQEHADALSGAPDQIMANAIEHAMQEQEGEVENREPAPQQIVEAQPQVAEEPTSEPAQAQTPASETSAAASTYTDREGNTRDIVHNEGGLKGTIHQSEIGAVQAEMREAFNAAREGDANAAMYAHALSHFLGRGNDERSPHPGMRQEGLLKHQLADKMVTRLEAKQNALENARNGGDEEDIADATEDLEATRKACRTIADKCGITADMLPEDHALRAVIGGNAQATTAEQPTAPQPPRATNPQHQPLVDALHNLANPTPTEEPTQPTNGDLPDSGIERAQAMHQRDPISQTQIHDLATAYVEQLGREGTIVNPDLFEREIERLAQGQNYDDNAVNSGMSNNETYLNQMANTLGNSHPVLNELRRRYGMPEAQPVEQPTAQTASSTAEPTNETPSSASPVNQEPQTPTTRPTDAQIDEIVNHVVQNGNGNINADVVRRIINDAANGEMANEIESVGFSSLSNFLDSYPNWVNGLGDLPAFQALRNHVRSLEQNQQSATTQEPTPAQPAQPTAQTQQTTQEPAAPAQPTGNASHLGEQVNADGTRTYSFGRDRQMDRGSSYEWPVRRGQAITREQITPELIDGVVSNLPTGRRGWGHRHTADLVYQALQNPSRAGYRARNVIERMMQSSNTHARRFQQVMNALHPDYVQRVQEEVRQREERDRQQRQSFEARNFVNDSVRNQSNGSRLNITDEQYADAVNRVVAQVGESHRAEAEQALTNFRNNGASSMDSLSNLRRYLGADHQVYQEAERSVRQHMDEANRAKLDHRRFKPEMPNRQANDEVMRNAGVNRRQDQSETDFGANTHASGFNCYMNDVYGMFNQFGYDVGRPPSRDSSHTGKNTAMFFEVKKGLVDSGAEPIKTQNTEESKQKLDELARTRPNGTWLSLWRAGHNVSAVLFNGKWYRHDIFGGQYMRPISSDDLAREVWPQDKVIHGNGRDPGIDDAVANGYMSRRPTDEEIGTYAAPMVIDPSKFKVTPALAKAIKRRQGDTEGLRI